MQTEKAIFARARKLGCGNFGVAILSGNRRARRHGAQPGYAGEGRNGERDAPAGGDRPYADCLVVNRFHYSGVPYHCRPASALRSAGLLIRLKRSRKANAEF
jgi:hypothetical protein